MDVDPVRLVWELVTARAESDAGITALHRTASGPGVTGEPRSSQWCRR